MPLRGLAILGLLWTASSCTCAPASNIDYVLKGAIITSEEDNILVESQRVHFRIHGQQAYHGPATDPSSRSFKTPAARPFNGTWSFVEGSQTLKRPCASAIYLCESSGVRHLTTVDMCIDRMIWLTDDSFASVDITANNRAGRAILWQAPIGDSPPQIREFGELLEGDLSFADLVALDKKRFAIILRSRDRADKASLVVCSTSGAVLKSLPLAFSVGGRFECASSAGNDLIAIVRDTDGIIINVNDGTIAQRVDPPGDSISSWCVTSDGAYFVACTDYTYVFDARTGVEVAKRAFPRFDAGPRDRDSNNEIPRLLRREPALRVSADNRYLYFLYRNGQATRYTLPNLSSATSVIFGVRQTAE